jgi:hypothetical protein
VYTSHAQRGDEKTKGAKKIDIRKTRPTTIFQRRGRRYCCHPLGTHDTKHAKISTEKKKNEKPKTKTKTKLNNITQAFGWETK